MLIPKQDTTPDPIPTTDHAEYPGEPVKLRFGPYDGQTMRVLPEQGTLLLRTRTHLHTYHREAGDVFVWGSELARRWSEQEARR